jgi:hypothetical protein
MQGLSEDSQSEPRSQSEAPSGAGGGADSDFSLDGVDSLGAETFSSGAYSHEREGSLGPSWSRGRMRTDSLGAAAVAAARVPAGAAPRAAPPAGGAAGGRRAVRPASPWGGSWEVSGSAGVGGARAAQEDMRAAAVRRGLERSEHGLDRGGAWDSGAPESDAGVHSDPTAPDPELPPFVS